MQSKWTVPTLAVIIAVVLSMIDTSGYLKYIEAASTGLSLALSFHFWVSFRRLQREFQVMNHQWFEIGIRLCEGFEEPCAQHDISEVLAAFASWISMRRERGEFFVTGMIHPAILTFPYRRDGADGSKIMQHQVAICRGALIPDYDRDRSEEEVLNTVIHLAKYLGQSVKQPIVYVTCSGKQMTLKDFLEADLSWTTYMHVVTGDATIISRPTILNYHR